MNTLNVLQIIHSPLFWLRRIVHNNIMIWKHLAHWSPFVKGIHWSPVDSPHSKSMMRTLHVLCCYLGQAVEQAAKLTFETHQCVVIVMFQEDLESHLGQASGLQDALTEGIQTRQELLADFQVGGNVEGQPCVGWCWMLEHLHALWCRKWGPHTNKTNHRKFVWNEIWQITTLRSESCHNDKFVVTGGTSRRLS